MPHDLAAFNSDGFRRAVLDDALVWDIWDQKYRFKDARGNSDEASVAETRARVVDAVYEKDQSNQARDTAHSMVQGGFFVPAGRINAGAGTGRAVTLLNCYVGRTIQDSMPGIQRSIAEAALTMQQGGGIGVDFSTIRPAGALVSRTGSIASGAIPFADQQDAMCKTIVSAGTRRGAMMLTLRDDHPDLWNPNQFDTITDYTGNSVLRTPSFISAKRQKGRLTQFNVSVLVSDAFMRAVAADKYWDLGFFVPPAASEPIDVYERPFPYDYREETNEWMAVDAGKQIHRGARMPWFVYRRVKARTIWEDLMRSTYTYAEPGIIFIDRVNQRNNLSYCETINSTNPCGEQPLPPFGCCNLGSVNTAFMVDHPFSDKAQFNFDRFNLAVATGIRFLDNVLDVAGFPLAAQKEESDRKRRIGLGITGWGDCLLQMGYRYGSQASIDLSRTVARRLQHVSYETSIELAAERGPFPAYERTAFAESWNVKKLAPELQDQLAKHGIRNGVLNTIAPNGTISVYTGNVSSGVEPVFSFAKVMRKVRQADGSLKQYESVDYAYRLYEAMHGETPPEKLPDYFVGAMDISPAEHIDVQAAWQEFVDASLSKTVNCATDMAYEDFKDVYIRAYETGCKGCTTYRYDPEAGRGSVLSVEPSPQADAPSPDPKPQPAFLAPLGRPEILEGRTYKLKWPLDQSNWYLTITNENGIPRELFIVTKDAQHQEWVTALSRMVTAVLRRDGDVRFLAAELTEVVAATGGASIRSQGRYRPSVVAAIGGVLEMEFRRLGILPPLAPHADAAPSEAPEIPIAIEGASLCPKCQRQTFLHENGCKRCLSCGHEVCG